MVNQIFSFGSNFKHLNTTLRSKYLLDYSKLKAISTQLSLDDFFVVNTCNRSEIYGLGNVENIKKNIFESAQVEQQDQKHFFAYQGHKALEHIFSVVCGLDSQIIGDNEIAGQFKNAFMDAKKHNSTNGFLEKMANFCLQASKEIKTNTELSNGTSSVSYATTQYIADLNLGKISRILVVGTGTIGKAIARNIKQYIPSANLCVCNRTDEKAKLLAKEIDADYLLFEHLPHYVSGFDVIVSCIHIQDKPLFNSQCNWAKTNIHIIDLSVPSSVDKSLYNLPHITIKNVDTISKKLHNTFAKRNQAVPIAKQIMEKHIALFVDWSKVYDNKNAIEEWKDFFDKASEKCPFIRDLTDDAKQTLKHKSTGALVDFIRKETDLNKSNILEKYRLNNSHNHPICLTASDCIKNKLNCFICNHSN